MFFEVRDCGVFLDAEDWRGCFSVLEIGGWIALLLRGWFAVVTGIGDRCCTLLPVSHGIPADSGCVK